MTLEKPRTPSEFLDKSKTAEKQALERRHLWTKRFTKGIATAEALIGLTGMVAGVQDLRHQPERAADELGWSSTSQLEGAHQEATEGRLHRRNRKLRTAQKASSEAQEGSMERIKNRSQVQEVGTKEGGRDKSSESLDRKMRDRIEQGHAEVGGREKRALGADASDSQKRLEALRKKYSGGRTPKQEG